jgi:hypothetical protein
MIFISTVSFTVALLFISIMSFSLVTPTTRVTSQLSHQFRFIDKLSVNKVSSEVSIYGGIAEPERLRSRSVFKPWSLTWRFGG